MSGEPEPKDVCAEEEREALILLQVDDVTVNEVKGQRRTELDKGTLTVLKIAASPEEVQELGCRVDPDQSGGTSEIVFVIVGEHKIPIINNVPVLKKEDKKYTFLMPGLFLEIVMPDDVDEEETEVLELLLKQNGVFRIKGEAVPPPSTFTVDQSGQRAEAPGSVGDRMSTGIQFVGQKMVNGMQTATPAVTGGMQRGAGFACEKITPNERPAEIQNQQAIREARMATKTAVIVSGQMANAMVGLARTLGSRLGAAVGSSQAGARMESGTGAEAKKVAQTGITTAAEVLDQASASIKIILTGACDGVSQVVGHKYGEDAGGACREGLGCVEDVVATGMNLKQVGVKGLAKAAGKQAARDVLSSEGGGNSQPSNATQ
eukprot:TRINITY_DN8255_c0_g1_i1.p1 TRINITY_DN8255_c0_g1~~TRINITY_DN8255_c0_g1_i1.p1  ORF type:complete len:388 (+),score=145.73 TRINITY_DN8255_c0_g1_i1:38-1165(+)